MPAVHRRPFGECRLGAEGLVAALLKPDSRSRSFSKLPVDASICYKKNQRAPNVQAVLSLLHGCDADHATARSPELAGT
jgi:hypothetical protein